MNEAEVSSALADFDGLWDALTLREQRRVLELLIERVDYDGQQGNISITFQPCGIKALTQELTRHQEEAA